MQYILRSIWSATRQNSYWVQIFSQDIFSVWMWKRINNKCYIKARFKIGIVSKTLSFLSRNDNIFARNENIGKICKWTITWTDFINTYINNNKEEKLQILMIQVATNWCKIRALIKYFKKLRNIWIRQKAIPGTANEFWFAVKKDNFRKHFNPLYGKNLDLVWILRFYSSIVVTLW
jgi:hypothetical protein